MHTLAHFIVMFTFLTGTSLIFGEVGVLPVSETKAISKDLTKNDSQAIHLDQDAIFLAWGAREKALSAGELHWDVLDDSISPVWYSKDDIQKNDKEVGNRDSFSSRLRFNKMRVRFDGECVPLLNVLSFDEAFHSGFLKQDSISILQPYTVVIDSEWSRHLWSRRGEHGPLFLTTHRQESLHAESASLFQRPVRLLLVDAALWALRPLSLPGRPLQYERCSILSERPLYGGQKCLAIQEQTTSDSIPVTRTYWIDPSRGFVIVRMLHSVNKVLQSQLDIQYELSKERDLWLPSQWSALQLDKHGDVQQFASAIRVKFEENSHPIETFQIDIPHNARQIFKDWGQEPHQSFHLEERPEIERRWERAGQFRIVRHFFLKLTTWPWTLVTLLGIWGLLALVRRLLPSRFQNMTSGRRTNVRKRIMGVILITLIAFLLRDMHFLQPPTEDILQEYDDIWTLGRELRKQHVTESEWNRFAEQAQQRINEFEEFCHQKQAGETTSKIERSEMEVRSLLLVIGQKHLSAMLQHGRQKAVSEEIELDQFFKDAKGSLFMRRIIYKKPAKNDFWILESMVLLGTGTIVCALFFYFRRRKLTNRVISFQQKEECSTKGQERL